MRSRQRSLLSLPTWRGYPLPSGPGKVTSPALPLEYSCYLQWGYCYAGQVVSTTWKGASTPPLTLEVTVSQMSFLPPPSLLALVAWVWDVEVYVYIKVTSYMYVEVTSYLYVFAPDYATAQQSWH